MLLQKVLTTLILYITVKQSARTRNQERGNKMTKQEIAVCEKTVNDLKLLERENQGVHELTEKNRFARSVVMKMMNNLDYRVSIPEPGGVHIFKGDKL